MALGSEIPEVDGVFLAPPWAQEATDKHYKSSTPFHQTKGGFLRLTVPFRSVWREGHTVYL